MTREQTVCVPVERHWLIFFEDHDMRPEIFTDEAAARKRHADLLSNWSCHLFVSTAPGMREALVGEREAVIEELIAELTVRADKLNERAQALFALDNPDADREAEPLDMERDQTTIAIRILRALSARTHEQQQGHSAQESGFAKVSAEAQARMATWPQERRDAVQLQGKLHYERCVPASSANETAVAGESPDARDAARYRWVREHGCEYDVTVNRDGSVRYVMLKAGALTPSGKLLDAAVDAAMGSPTDDPKKGHTTE